MGWQACPERAEGGGRDVRGRDRKMLRRRYIAQEDVAGKAEKGESADAGVWECEYTAGSVYCGAQNGRRIAIRPASAPIRQSTHLIYHRNLLSLREETRRPPLLRNGKDDQHSGPEVG